MTNKIAETAIIYPHVKLGQHVVVEDYCIIGAPTKDGKTEETIIGDHAHIRSHTVIYSGNKIGSHFQTGNKVNIRENNHIGNHVSVGTLSVVEHHVTIFDKVRIHTQVFVPEYTTIEEGAWLGPNVVLTNAKFPLSPNVKNELKGPLIKQKVIVGANSTVLPHLVLAEECIIGAGSVVTKSTEERGVYVGNPAKLMKHKDKLPYQSVQVEASGSSI